MNADPDITDTDNIKAYEELVKKRKWGLYFNNCTEEDMVKVIKEYNHIITNSYHAAYWGLLSGHKVTILGYSTKFISLLKGFGFKGTELIQIQRGNKVELFNTIKRLKDETDAIGLDNYQKILEDFRNLNISFASKLVKKGIINGFSLKDKTLSSFD